MSYTIKLLAGIAIPCLIIQTPAIAERIECYPVPSASKQYPERLELGRTSEGNRLELDIRSIRKVGSRKVYFDYYLNGARIRNAKTYCPNSEWFVPHSREAIPAFSPAARDMLNYVCGYRRA